MTKKPKVSEPDADFSNSDPQHQVEETEQSHGEEANHFAEDSAQPTKADEDPLANTTGDELEQKLLAAEALAAENLDGWQRAQADYQNYKRRALRDMEETRKNTAATLLGRFFPIIDDMERALHSVPQATEVEQWSDGINLVYRKLLSLLESENISPIDAAPGQEFDPRIHEAVIQEETPEFKDGEITAVLRPGYQLGERVLRAAQVRVAK